MKVDSYQSKAKSAGADHVSVLVKSGEPVDTLPPEVKDAVGTLELWKTLDLDVKEPRVGLDVTAAIADIEKQGYHVSRVQVTTTVKDVPRPPEKRA
ncbi:hypothetical protein [Variovorax paradoxus]|uniref:Uncharacterized protein n=1 Tax=Variovorax paradoxus TaxID=34073 RepID=A0A0H2MCK2_VARPD|nr:hypothetical protein [Variovorax paradoxus]KLN54695.1 hypothetical protein VPARA_39990 [Variovorax paradoxus]